MMITRVLRNSFSTAGSLYTWGETTYGWGRKPNNDLLVPGKVEGFDDVVSVATGPYHMLFKTLTGEVFSVGLGDHGRLGHGTTTTLDTPESITELSGLNITQLAAGWDHSLALTDKGDVYSWGFGGYCGGVFKYLSFFEVASPLGHGESGNVSTPRLVEGFSEGIKQVAAGKRLSLALGESGKVYGWGGNISEFNAEPSSVPIELEEIDYFLHKHHAHVTKIASSGVNAFFLLDNGRIYSIGKNEGGNLATRNNPRVMTDLNLHTLTKVIDQDYKNERITDFKVSNNSLIFTTDAGSVFYSGMHTKYRPERFHVKGPVSSIFATMDSVGVIHQDGKIQFVNDSFIEQSVKRGEVIVNADESLNKAFEIGGSHRLRYALVKN